MCSRGTPQTTGTWFTEVEHISLCFSRFSGTRTTFTVKPLINTLQSHCTKCLICGTMGIAAVRYPGGTTLHSLFRLGMDEQSRGGVRSNIRRGTPLARDILAADLIIIYEVSMLTSWVANKVSLALQSTYGYERIQFGGKRILFVGDLLQLPSIVPDFSMPVAYRLITRLPYWSSIRKIQTQQPMRASDPSWTTSCSQWERARQMRFRIGGNSRDAFMCLSPRRLALLTIPSVTG
jgi:hypothetical protein